jgi:hypothetical protein
VTSQHLSSAWRSVTERLLEKRRVVDHPEDVVVAAVLAGPHHVDLANVCQGGAIELAAGPQAILRGEQLPFGIGGRGAPRCKRDNEYDARTESKNPHVPSPSQATCQARAGFSGSPARGDEAHAPRAEQDLHGRSCKSCSVAHRRAGRELTLAHEVFVGSALNLAAELDDARSKARERRLAANRSASCGRCAPAAGPTIPP